MSRNAIREMPYQELIVTRCAFGHYDLLIGVLPEVNAEPPIDDGPQDCWGAF